MTDTYRDLVYILHTVCIEMTLIVSTHIPKLKIN